MHSQFSFFIIGHKVLNRILREELLHFRVKLARQGFIVRNDQCRLLQLLYHVGHCEGLARSCDTEQSLELVAFPEALHQFFYCLRLVAGGLIFRYKFELILCELHNYTSENP